MPLCQTCTNLHLPTLFHDPKTSNYDPIQQYHHLATLANSAPSCNFCGILWKLVSAQYVDLPHDAAVAKGDVIFRLYLMDYGIVQIDERRDDVARLFVSIAPGDGKQVFFPCGLQVMAGVESKSSDDRGDQSSLLRGRAVPSVVDVGLIKRWIGMCCEEHGEICQPAEMRRETNMLVIRVIDTQSMCVVDLPEGSEYVVLSYVWGSFPQLCLLKENRQELMEPGGLESHLQKLPGTISDSMDLVRQLRQRYLWVDALCIVQDDPADLAAQIQHMNVVYSCAALTIVAACGSDSNARLAGLMPGSRDSVIIDEHVQGVHLVTALPNFTSAISTSVWESRGWTMQEKVLSKRLVIFTEFQVFYHCNSATWCEDAIWESHDPHINLQPGYGTLSPALVHCTLPHRNFSGLRKYSHLVTGYHTRQLSHQNDALNAFTGALTELSKELETPFHLGLPEASFTETIVWHSPIHDASLRRVQFPSWTWLGWKPSGLPGDLQFSVVNRTHLQTIPLVDWHRVTASGDHQRVGEEVANHRPQRHLPEFEERLRFPPDATATHLLRFWAMSAFLYIGRVPLPTISRFDQFGTYTYAIGMREADGEERQFGIIALHESWRNAQPDLMEFVAICKTRARDLYNEEVINEGLELMLVETVGDLSFRVQMASRPVMEAWWEYTRPRWRVVTLG